MIELEAPVFVLVGQDGRPGLMTMDELTAWAMLEGVPHERLVRVDSWRGEVVAEADDQGLVEPTESA